MVVDSNVIIDVATGDPVWHRWSIQRLDEGSMSGALVVNDIIFAEVSSRYDRVAGVEELFDGMGLVMEPIPRLALFLAGHAYKRYRQNGGVRTNVLPDFLIGAHASVLGVPLLTRDTRRYRTYFPRLELIAPDQSQGLG